MDQALVGTLLLGAVSIPYALEVFAQVRLQARFLSALPAPLRAALPAHPRRPFLAFMGSIRFSLALWRCFRRDHPDDATELLTLKREMRTSLRREIVWGLVIVFVLVLLTSRGWRPIWP